VALAGMILEVEEREGNFGERMAGLAFPARGKAGHTVILKVRKPRFRFPTMYLRKRNDSPGVGRSRGASYSATQSGNTLRGTHRKRSPRLWIEFARKLVIQGTNSFRPLPVGFLSETNGDFAKRSLVGGFTDSDRIWSGIQTPGRRGSRGRFESQPDPDCGGRASDKQPSMGKCAGECLALGSLDRLAERFGGERLSDCDSRSRPSLRNEWASFLVQSRKQF
jgi:hypothetical protein